MWRGFRDYERSFGALRTVIPCNARDLGFSLRQMCRRCRQEPMSLALLGMTKSLGFRTSQAFFFFFFFGAAVLLAAAFFFFGAVFESVFKSETSRRLAVFHSRSRS